MKIKDILNKLANYNLEADFNIVVNNSSKPFSICFGTSDGCKPNNCECVDFVVDGLEEVANNKYEYNKRRKSRARKSNRKKNR